MFHLKIIIYRAKRGIGLKKGMLWTPQTVHVYSLLTNMELMTAQNSIVYTVTPPRPAVVIPRASEEDLRMFVTALREGGYLEEEDEISFQNVSEDFTI